MFKTREKTYWRCVLKFSWNLRFFHLTMQIYRAVHGKNCAQLPNACIEPLPCHSALISCTLNYPDILLPAYCIQCKVLVINNFKRINVYGYRADIPAQDLKFDDFQSLLSKKRQGLNCIKMKKRASGQCRVCKSNYFAVLKCSFVSVDIA